MISKIFSADWFLLVAVTLGLCIILIIAAIARKVRRNKEYTMGRVSPSSSPLHKRDEEDDEEGRDEPKRDEEEDEEDEDEPMTWKGIQDEYDVELGEHYAICEQDLTAKQLDVFFENGWELITADDSCYYFKRLPDKN